MKNIFKKIIAVIMMCSIISIPSYASTYANIGYDVTAPSDIISGNRSNSRAIDPRGMYISTAFLELKDAGNGLLNVQSMILAHQTVDSFGFDIYLDCYVEDEKRWAMVADYEFEFKREDSDDPLFSYKMIDFNIVGQPKNATYRLRGLQRVAVGDSIEYLSTKTQGVELK